MCSVVGGGGVLGWVGVCGGVGCGPFSDVRNQPGDLCSCAQQPTFDTLDLYAPTGTSEQAGRPAIEKENDPVAVHWRRVSRSG